MSTIDETRMENAMTFLAETDEVFANAKADMLRAEILVDRAKARCFMIADGNVEERKSIAKTAGDTIGAEDVYISRVADFEKLRAKRQRAELLIDVWRSLEASRRKT